MTAKERNRELKKLANEVKKIHAAYASEFRKLNKRQKDLLKKVAARVEAVKINELKKAIGKKA
jgi:hypothetical protein